MADHKRKSSSTNDLNRVSKRTRSTQLTTSDEVIEIEDDEDDIDAILARIQEQEESEQLARRLQKEWDENMAPSDVIDLTMESDEALARDLAQEWEKNRNKPGESGQSSTVHSHISSVTQGSPATPARGSVSSVEIAESHDEVHARISRPTNPPVIGTRPDIKLLEYRDVFTKTRECSNCHKAVHSPRGHVMFTGTSLPPSLTVLMHASCTSCKTNHCRGCFSPVRCPVSCKGPSKNIKCTITTCCAEGRAIALFEMLGGFDRQYIIEKTSANSRSMTLAKKVPVCKASVGPGGTGYGTGDQGRPRYGQVHMTFQAPKPSQAEKLAAHWDGTIVRALETLTELLPSPYADSTQMYDLVPHASIGLLLSLSMIPNLLVSLLRNDSVKDWIARNQVYHAMIFLLRRMADCELSVQVLIGQRWEIVESPGLESWMWGEGKITWEQGTNTVPPVLAPPLYQYFNKLSKQCEASQTGASQMALGSLEGEDDLEETMTQAASLCGDIIAAKADIERVMSILGIKPLDKTATVSTGASCSSIMTRIENDKGKAKLPDIGRSYTIACEKQAFKYVMFTNPHDIHDGKGLRYTNYNYANKLEQTQSATRPQSRRFHLVKELAVMATSLPPGIWVRADETRNDAIKVMIAGPDGTPYAGGLFEFDCFMPPEYPNSPPLVHLRTTGGGTVRFNPNLYVCGKVCLSLLGTWPGRPGHGRVNLEARVSIDYNREVSYNAARWAIVGWLRDENKDSLWRDVIASHFCLLKDKIRGTMIECAANSPQLIHGGRRSSNGPTLSALIQEFDIGVCRLQAWNTAEDESPMA